MKKSLSKNLDFGLTLILKSYIILALSFIKSVIDQKEKAKSAKGKIKSGDQKGPLT